MLFLNMVCLTVALADNKLTVVKRVKKRQQKPSLFSVMALRIALFAIHTRNIIKIDRQRL